MAHTEEPHRLFYIISVFLNVVKKTELNNLRKIICMRKFELNILYKKFSL